MIHLLRTLTLSLLLGTAAFAQFEGNLDIKLSMEAGGGDLKLQVSKPGTRIDMTINAHPLPQPIRMTLLMRADQPSKAYMLNDQQKTFSEINLEEAAKMSSSEPGKPYTVKVGAKEKILGYNATHVTLTRPNEKVEMWITKDLDVYKVFKQLQSVNPQMGGEAELFQALEKAGLQGFPLKSQIVREGETVTMETRKVEKKALPASLFEIPKDYKKAAVPGFPGAQGQQPTPEQLEEMRRMIEDAMRNAK